MNSLQFLSAWNLVQDEKVACKVLEFLPWHLFDVLFKVAFWNHKNVLLFNLVKMWPYSDLKVKKLLQSCQRSQHPPDTNCPDCLGPLPCTEFDKNIFDAILQGVILNIKKAMDHGSKQISSRRLQRVDITGFLTNKLEWNIHFMSMWANSLIQIQAGMFPGQNIHDPQSQAMDPVMEALLLRGIPKEARVDLLVDLQVSIEAKGFLIETIQRNAESPLHLICRDVWNVNLSAQALAEFLFLLDPMLLQRVDLGPGMADLMKTNYCLKQISRLQNLQSLRLCFLDQDERLWLSPRKKAHFNNFANNLSKLKQLKEIALCHIQISGHLEYTLRDIQGPLESIELAFCSLDNKDFSYLAQSCHGPNLIKLDLSGTNLTNKLNSFLELLKAASNKLIYLNITMCKLEDTHFHAIIPSLCRCKNLSHLALFGNPLSIKSLRALKEQLQKKVLNLKVLSFPIFLKNPFQQGLLQSLTNCEDLHQLLFIPRMPVHFAFDMGDYFEIRQWSNYQRWEESQSSSKISYTYVYTYT